MKDNRFLQFPKEFVWGTATAAYQIEGAWDAGGKGPSIWDRFVHTPGKIFKEQNADIAVDHYHRWAEDVELMSQLGVNAYRFSTAWSRILPQGAGQVNQAGIDFYDRLVDGLLERGIQPYLTLFHWDLPQALQDEGGWTERATAERFAEYASLMAKHLGDRVAGWITHNEPQVVALIGHFLGEHAPGVQDPTSALQTTYHLLLSHGLAVGALRAAIPKDRPVGITLNLNPVHPASKSDADHLAARNMDAVLNRLFLDPIFHGRFPAEMDAIFGPMFPMPSDEDLETMSVPIDFLGINYYSRAVVRRDPEFPFIEASIEQPQGKEYSQMWEIFPQGLYEVLSRVWEEYRPQAIVITENGIPVADAPDLDGRVRDYRRIRYLRDHLAQVHRALADGVSIKGYFAWSLMDNFEWAHGYSKRFGLIYVDFDTLVRTIKESGHWYSKVIKERGFDRDFCPSDFSSDP